MFKWLGVVEYPQVIFLQALVTIKASFTKFMGLQDGYEVQGVELRGLAKMALSTGRELGGIWSPEELN